MSTKRRYEQRARAERAAETRRRITEATMALHEEVGPARTTVAEVARRAGVQRLTVYNHFPEERDLLAACQGHFRATFPPPDPSAAFALADPEERLRAVLVAFYGWFRETEAMSANVLRDAEVLPALAGLLRETEGQMDDLIAALAAGFGRSGRVRAAVALALDFWAWRRLARSGLSDKVAADVMVGAVRAAA